jgi:N-acetylglucosaminyldiphosphoundecaprenol N-acetyl-beta-D-mannosaminyltransferase
MAMMYPVDDYDVHGFVRVAADFGIDKFGYVVTPNTDHLIRFHDEPGFRDSYADASYILLDSQFLSYVFRWTKGIRTRVCTGSDLTSQLLHSAITPSDHIVLIGGEQQQADLLIDQFGLKCLSHYNPPMGFIGQPEAVEACLQFVEAQSPFRFCFLAVGAPQQELLASRLKARGVARGLALCIGASINFLTGAERRAPRWMRRIGLEWLFRLMLHPERLAQRYLVRGPRVFSLIGRTDVKVRPALVRSNGSGRTRASLDATNWDGMGISPRTGSWAAREALSGARAEGFLVASADRLSGATETKHTIVSPTQ